ncbi:unnamed protein product [Spirodela intermedia]|uniref:Uncharacterized protein n=2 Tax=Spirodela intermedia TaxID=51605 RepID=A0A7I8KT77_SPIIN|nr:unnamed protein product [Spirodela intermedia]CAA6653907.1 unnamed protein product [Spirodela intermedia]CAA7400682.1 unnamed protein product [Spirodela intermedia]
MKKGNKGGHIRITSAHGERESGRKRVPPGDSYIFSQSLEINEMGRRVIFGGCHPVEWKNGDFAALWRLFILKSAEQEEALHHIWYALKRWRLVSRRIVLFPTTTCSSINQR